MKNSSYAIEKLKAIGAKHGKDKSESNIINYLNASKQYKNNFNGLKDILIDTANLSITLNEKNFENIDPLTKKAILDTNPNFDFNNPPIGNELQGSINSAKGKLFEYRVVERLNNGERVGNILLPEGWRAELAEKFNQPGFDLTILNDNNEIEEYLQLKATNTIYPIKNALDRYPSIRILTTDEIANSYSDDIEILDSDISNEYLTQEIEEAMNATENLAETYTDHFCPIASLIYISLTEGYQLAINKKELKKTKSSFVKRTKKSLITQGIGGCLYTLGCAEIIALPAAILTRLTLDHLDNEKKYIDLIQKNRRDMLQMLIWHQEMKIS